MLNKAATLTFGALALATAATTASATVLPYTEFFATNNANWGGGGDWTAFNPLAWTAPGDGPVAGAGYVTATHNFVEFSPGGFPLTLFRGQDNYNSSNGAFVGNWIDGNIIDLSFWVRHDAPEDLVWFVRLTPAGANSPSMNFEFTSQPVAAGSWTKLSVVIDQDFPGWVVGGGPNTWNSVFGNLGKIQIGAHVGDLAGIDEDFNFDLSMVSIAVPAPGAIALFALAGIARSRRRRG